ncbi:hypothetical protein MKW98_031387 [Papaver atlanticum]|uniref:Uncharacterized protein n=1 Tax=Papaver atlanticum TaxID=357466 RepID=A0AAD4X8E4_9MAGN|nr:hypothetical protein MKW98_031387 [Papaver atlanticum]
MEKTDDGKTDKTPQLKPHNRPFNVFDAKNTFAAIIPISAKTLYKLCFPNKDQKLSSEFDVLNVILSNTEIRISSLVHFQSDKIKIQIPTAEPISFGIDLKSFTRALKIMKVVRKRIHRIVIAYQAEENRLIIANGRVEVFIKTDGHLDDEEFSYTFKYKYTCFDICNFMF